MALTQNQILKGELKQKISSTEYDVLYPKTSADVVVYNSTTVKDALDALSGRSLFWVTYNSTPYADITNALSAGKLPICKHGTDIYIYQNTQQPSTDNVYFFYNIYYQAGAVNNQWHLQSFAVQSPSTYTPVDDCNMASLDNNGKILVSNLPDIVLGNMLFGGTITFANNNAAAELSANGKTRLGTSETDVTLIGAASSTIANTYGWVATEGMYFLASAEGEFKYTSDADAVTFNIGDWLVSTGTAWTKVDNVDAVTGVKGNAETTYRTGNINLTAANIGAAESSHAHGNITSEGKLDKSLHAVTTDASGTIIAEDLSVSDPSVGSTPGSSFIATISQDAAGQISATKQNVQLGNITHEGKLQASDVTIASGDKLVITDASNSNKIARSSLAFDGSTINQFLSKKGTWQTVDPNSILWFNYNSISGTISGTTGADIAGAITAGKWPVAKDENGFMYELASHTVITGGAEDVDRFTFAGIINNAGMLFLNYFIIDSVSGTTVVSKGQIPFLASTGVAAGNYSAVAVNSDGLVTEGKQAIMVLDKTATPADPDSKLNSLATYGWYFEATAKG